jgi:hypothetical protein
LAGAGAPADDLTSKDGRTYKDYKVQKSDDDGVTIQYTETVTIPYDNLPDDIQKKYGHDPNALSAEQAAEKARVEAENKEAARVEAALDDQDHQLEPGLAAIKSKATAAYALAPKVTLSGQIFVSTQGGEVVEFSNVEVGLYPVELINLWLPEKQARLAAENKLLQPRIDRAQQDEDKALKQRSDAVGSSRFSAALDRESAARDILETLKERQDYFTGGGYLYDQLISWAVATATTDLSGKFTLKAPATGDFVLSASVKSERGTTIRKYFWFVKIHSADTTPGGNAYILLDSENLSSSGSADSILKTEASSLDDNPATDDK